MNHRNQPSSIRRVLGNERGVAMMMALTTITILVVLAAELVYETTVYHRMVFNAVDQVRAQYLAKSGLKLAQLQLVGTMKAKQFIKNLGQNAPISPTEVDRIWQTPIILPPPLPSSISSTIRDSVNKLNNELGFGGTISINISGQSGKLNLNRLVWLKQSPTGQQGQQQPPADPNALDLGIGQPAPGQPNPSADPLQAQQQRQQQLQSIRANYIRVINELLRRKRESDKEFFIKYETISGEQLIGNLVAWMDASVELDGDNSPKFGYYRSLSPPIAIKNAPLFSMSELHMVKDFDDTLITLISESFTASLTDSINVNQIGDDLLRALIPTITDDAIERFNERRNLNPFKSVDDFMKFAKESMDLGDEQKQELEKSGFTLDVNETAYRVLVDVKSGDARKIWLADIGPPPPRPIVFNPTQNVNNPAVQPGQGANPANPAQTGQTQQSTTSSETPVVIYLKAD